MKAIDDYLAAWNAETSDIRHTLLVCCLTPDVTYIDPHVSDPVQGIAALQDLIKRFRERFDHQLQPDGSIDSHHQVFRLRWYLQRENGAVLSRGLMVGDLTATGMIQRIVHFVD